MLSSILLIPLLCQIIITLGDQWISWNTILKAQKITRLKHSNTLEEKLSTSTGIWFWDSQKKEISRPKMKRIPWTNFIRQKEITRNTSKWVQMRDLTSHNLARIIIWRHRRMLWEFPHTRITTSAVRLNKNGPKLAGISIVANNMVQHLERRVSRSQWVTKRENQALLDTNLCRRCS